jgi:hypothetical protein
MPEMDDAPRAKTLSGLAQLQTPFREVGQGFSLMGARDPHLEFHGTTIDLNLYRQMRHYAK